MARCEVEMFSCQPMGQSQSTRTLQSRGNAMQPMGQRELRARRPGGGGGFLDPKQYGCTSMVQVGSTHHMVKGGLHGTVEGMLEWWSGGGGICSREGRRLCSVTCDPLHMWPERLQPLVTQKLNSPGMRYEISCAVLWLLLIIQDSILSHSLPSYITLSYALATLYHELEHNCWPIVNGQFQQGRIRVRCKSEALTCFH